MYRATVMPSAGPNGSLGIQNKLNKILCILFQRSMS